ncbi:MAG: hypothetical protein ABJL37_06150 [Ekhidna sp.]
MKPGAGWEIVWQAALLHVDSEKMFLKFGTIWWWVDALIDSIC